MTHVPIVVRGRHAKTAVAVPRAKMPAPKIAAAAATVRATTAGPPPPALALLARKARATMRVGLLRARTAPAKTASAPSHAQPNSPRAALPRRAPSVQSATSR